MISLGSELPPGAAEVQKRRGVVGWGIWGNRREGLSSFLLSYGPGLKSGGTALYALRLRKAGNRRFQHG